MALLVEVVTVTLRGVHLFVIDKELRIAPVSQRLAVAGLVVAAAAAPSGQAGMAVGSSR